MEYLINHGADIHAVNDYALIFASKNGHIAVVKYLVNHGANVHAKNNKALKYASRYSHLNVMEFLQSKM